MRLARPFELITPTVDGDILSVLANATGPFSGRQVHRLAGLHSEAGIRKGLDRLVEQGIVLRRRVGNTNLHSLNRDHLAAESIISLARLRETAFAFMGSLLDSWDQPPVLAAVFGSSAREEEKPDSDIDVFFLRPDGASDESWQRSMSQFSNDVSRATGNDVRLLDMTWEELCNPANDVLRKQLGRDAVILRGKRSALGQRVK